LNRLDVDYPDYTKKKKVTGFMQKIQTIKIAKDALKS